ncbi:nucleotide disphospho-sugar-binding domain-containing protein [Chitinophaga sp. LS1]|uniref:nucleotide disphospho-sugar-binding domain-containing protein n=1 Tax=Chitinophaga sp. LS1 TaxID=3051176 RepID=UPI002AAB513D|nr:nucleotide disphospho-sugar-binding domain-containing protein [Chitinophaga sp. LS1]WPV65676.1 glycosyltransferase [Chitinophaga sp. LS1]
MAKIAILMDAEEGHLLPTIDLSAGLRERGHEVLYVSICDNEKLVREYGFNFKPVLETIFPPGSREEFKRRHERQAADEPETIAALQEIINGAYDQLVNVIRPDIYIVSTFLRFDLLLLYYKYRIRPVVFTTYLRDPGVTLARDCIGDLLKIPPELTASLITFLADIGIVVSSLESLAAPLNTLQELVACPLELDLEPPARKHHSISIGPSIRESKNADPFTARIIEEAGTRPLIYASLGSQALSYGEKSKSFFRGLLSMMESEEMIDMYMVLAIGPEMQPATLGYIPPNVKVVNWISQLDILKRATLAIIHGGLGTVKECIYFGVPMIVVPINRDQPSNAERVVYHGLGKRADIDQGDWKGLKDQVTNILQDNNVTRNIKRMQQLFLEEQQSQRGVDAIEKLLRPIKRVEIRI